MTFYEMPYAEGVTFVTGRSAQVFPDTDAGTVTGTGLLPVPEHFRPGAERGLWHQSRAIPSPMCRPTAPMYPSR